MILLVCFDLPHDNKQHRKQVYRYRRKLLELGFTMKQYSLYEREIKNLSTIDNIIKILSEQIPDEGEITVYKLPDYVNDSQITILGEKIVKYSTRQPSLVVI
ncbi:CRISPR-associated endonuclease Cas2 [Macrococcus capreoli]